MTREAKQLVQSLNSAITKAHISNPKEIREAIQCFCEGDPDNCNEQAVIDAFIGLLEAIAGRKERALQEAFGTR